MRNKLLIAFVSCLLVNVGFSQLGITAGPGVTYGFGSGQLFKSVHLGLEIPRDEEASIVIRFAGSLRNSKTVDGYAEAIDPSITFPSQVQTKIRNSVSMYYIEGGTRRYFLGTGFDYGWAIYGGTLVNVSFYRLSSKAMDDIDKSKYQVQESNRGSAFLLNVGLQGGVKRQFTFGTLFADVNLTYAVIATTGPNTTVANGDFSSVLSPLNFNFAIGIRKDLYF